MNLVNIYDSYKDFTKTWNMLGDKWTGKASYRAE